MPTYKSQDSPL